MVQLFHSLWWPFRRDVQRAGGALLALVAMCGLFAFVTPGFLSSGNMSKLALQSVILLVLATGQTLVILTGGIDLSTGAVLGLSSLVAALALRADLGPLAIVLALGISTLFGLVNGWLVGGARFPAFVVTLGTMGIAQGLALVLSAGGSIPNLPEWFQWIHDGYFVGLPIPAWISFILIATVFMLLNATRFGFAISALGGNRDALRLSGMNPVRYEVGVYAFSGLCAGLAGIIMAARLNAGHPTVGLGLEFEAIAATIIGGTSFVHGDGGIIATVVGVALVAILRSGMNLSGVDPFLQLPIIGATIITAVAGSTVLARRRRVQLR